MIIVLYSIWHSLQICHLSKILILTSEKETNMKKNYINVDYLNDNHIIRKPNEHTDHIIKRRMIATSKEVRKEIYHHQSFSFSLKNDCMKIKFLFKARGSHSLKNVNILCLFHFLTNSHFRFWNQISPEGIDYPAYRYLENYLKELLSWT